MLASVLLPTVISATRSARSFLLLPERLDPTARLHGWSHGRDPADGPAAERCAYRDDCAKMIHYFNEMKAHE